MLGVIFKSKEKKPLFSDRVDFSSLKKTVLMQVIVFLFQANLALLVCSYVLAGFAIRPITQANRIVQLNGIIRAWG
jgi:hypothetical protein